MTALKKWLRRVGTGLIGVLGLGLGSVYGLSAYKLGHSPDVTAATIAVSSDAPAIDHGARLARILGCVGCHGEELGGRVFIDSPMFGRLVAPNLTRVGIAYSTTDFVRLLRHGVRPDGSPVLPAMPAQSFTYLADDDLAAIIAYVRSIPAVADSLPRTRLAIPLRAMLAVGVIEMTPAMIDHGREPERTIDRGNAWSWGAYLARTICTECHGPDLRGQDRFLITPNLAIVRAYSPEEFRVLLRTGRARGDRELPVMSSTARRRFSAYTDAELDALYVYLSTLAEVADATS